MAMLRGSTIVIASVAFASTAAGQATPFLFTVMPTGGTSRTTYGYYELGFGERTFEPVAGERFEHALGIRANLGSLR